MKLSKLPNVLFLDTGHRELPQLGASLVRTLNMNILQNYLSPKDKMIDENLNNFLGIKLF